MIGVMAGSVVANEAVSAWMDGVRVVDVRDENVDGTGDTIVAQVNEGSGMTAMPIARRGRGDLVGGCGDDEERGRRGEN